MKQGDLQSSKKGVAKRGVLLINYNHEQTPSRTSFGAWN